MPITTTVIQTNFLLFKLEQKKNPHLSQKSPHAAPPIYIIFGTRYIRSWLGTPFLENEESPRSAALVGRQNCRNLILSFAPNPPDDPQSPPPVENYIHSKWLVVIRIRSHELPFIRAEQIHSIRKNLLPLLPSPAQRLGGNAFADLLQVAPLPW